MVNPELADLAKRMGLRTGRDQRCSFPEQGRSLRPRCALLHQHGPADHRREPAEISDGALSQEPRRRCARRWAHFDGAIDNTVRIAEMCNLELDFSKRYAPVYRVPTEKLTMARDRSPCADAMQASAQLAHATTATMTNATSANSAKTGLIWRYGTTDVSAEIRQRLDYELSVIVKKNFCSYFLIVWDFCNFARDNGIPVGARGSGVGTMVGYLLGLCNVDPIKYGLLFERFMDPSRNEMPDIDIDICQDGRQKVIEYVRNKYGHVAQIITFGTLAAKAACKDVGRVLGVPLAEIDQAHQADSRHAGHDAGQGDEPVAGTGRACTNQMPNDQEDHRHRQAAGRPLPQRRLPRGGRDHRGSAAG